MVTFNLLDDIFSHNLIDGIPYAVAGRKSEYISWNKNINTSFPTFYSHNRIPQIIQDGFSEKQNSYGFIFESRSIFDYSTCEPYISCFQKVFTHNSEFLKKYSNCYWIPGGGIWIGGSYGLGEIKIYKKNNRCSIVSSQKRMCHLHNFRLDIVNDVKNIGVDVYGLDKYIPICETLKDYMFSIVVENYQDDLYFTEKILNCFATGTIPIYFGAKNIAHLFNIDGILQFNNIDELRHIIHGLNEDLYIKKFEAVVDNFNRCLKYKSIEDYIYLSYFS